MADYLSRSPVDQPEDDSDERNNYESKATQTETPTTATITTELIPTGREAKDTQSVANPPGDDSNRIVPFDLEDLKQQQEWDPEAQRLTKHISKQKNYVVENGILMRKQKAPLPTVPFVPASRMRADIMKIYHDTPANGAHFGRDKTTRKIQQRYYWPSMNAD